MNGSAAPDGKRNVGREALKGVGLAALLLLMMMWLAGAFVSKVEPGEAAPKPVPAGKLETWKVQRVVTPLVVDQVGSVRAGTEAWVASRVMAQVKDILVHEGDRVSGGTAGGTATVLARLDDAEARARLRQAEAMADAAKRAAEAVKARAGGAGAQAESARAARDRARADYRRTEDLHRHQAATGQQLDHSRAQRDATEAQLTATLREAEAARGDTARFKAELERAEAAISEARAMLAHTVIRAPFTGEVIRKKVDVGDMAAPGQPLFLVQTASDPELHAVMSESLLPRMEVGRKVDVHIDALDLSLPGTVREIVPQSDPATRTVLVKVSIPPTPGLVNGLFGRLPVVAGTYEALVVPARAVREVGQLHLVDVPGPDGVPERRFVTLGATRGDLVEVLSGLAEADEVVLHE